MDRLEELAVFVAIVEAGSLAAAARRTNRSPAAATRALPLSALVAQVDALRIGAADPPNLASALRTWLVADLSQQPTNLATEMKTILNSVDSANDSQ